MLKIHESPWGRRILASFACAEKLEQNAKSDKELCRQSECSITDAELDEYLIRKGYISTPSSESTKQNEDEDDIYLQKELEKLLDVSDLI